MPSTRSACDGGPIGTGTIFTNAIIALANGLLEPECSLGQQLEQPKELVRLLFPFRNRTQRFYHVR